MVKKDPLGENPLAESVLRDMIRGDKDKKAPRTTGKGSIRGEKPAIRKARTTVTTAGLLRKTVYFGEDEWRAIKKVAYMEDRPYTDIVREAKRFFEAGEVGAIILFSSESQVYTDYRISQIVVRKIIL